MCFALSAGNARWIAESTIWPWAIVVGASLMAAVIDLRTRRIPNALTGPLLLAGLAWGIACTVGAVGSAGPAVSRGVGDSLLGALVTGLPFFVLWMLKGSGAGDAKLMIVIGAWVGAKAALLVLLCTALAGGVVVIVWALAERRLLATLGGVPRAAVDVAFLARGPGTLEDRREVVLSTAAARAAESGDAAPTGSSSQSRHKLPYAPAIFIGTCAAATRVFFF